MSVKIYAECFPLGLPIPDLSKVNLHDEEGTIGDSLSSNLPFQELDPEILGKQIQEKEDQLVAISETLDQRADEIQKIQEKLVGLP